MLGSTNIKNIGLVYLVNHLKNINDSFLSIKYKHIFIELNILEDALSKQSLSMHHDLRRLEEFKGDTFISSMEIPL